MVDAMKVVNEGAEAKIYREKLLDANVVAKTRERKRYRNEKLDLYLREHRTKNEAKIMLYLEGKGIPLPKLLLVGKYTIFMDYIKGIRLSNMLKEMENRPNQENVEKYMEETGRYLGIMHNCNAIHGDFTPANLIISLGKVYVIDFGLSFISNSIEDKAIDLLLMKRALSKKLYLLFIDGYKKTENESGIIIEKLKEIEMRGRYQTRTLSAAN
ncbi:MAG: Kae1-associated serine/threonine protein kinase [Candidatus Marsarchaeota archaeon]|nr:Kae1-associated serine/threonine protein kinase [Candidatus Marsarchaeota archaeon]